MFFNNNKGITLEQYKEPMFSRKIIRLPVCDKIPVKAPEEKKIAPEKLADSDILVIARNAKIIDEYDGEHLWKKIYNAVLDNKTSVIIDAIDDEPYISSQISPAIEYSSQLAKGIALLKKALGTDDVKIEVYKNFLELDTKIPAEIGGVKVDFVGGTYPVEQRAHRAKRKKNASIFGVCSILALYKAVYEGMYHTTCYVTVAGDCIANPANYEVPIGYTVADVLSDAGLLAEPKRIIVGGSMTGVAVNDGSKVAVGATTRAILAFHDEFKKMEEACIGCGRCANVCPQNLAPFTIYQVLKRRKYDSLALLNADRCISCGLCSYICPAKLELQQSVHRAAEITKQIKEEKE